MNLKDIREKFRDISGRYDLVNDDLSDNGANFFINEGSRWLDRTVETTKSWASFMHILTAGEWYLRFPQARAIKEVWVATDEGRWQLEKKRLQDLIAGYYAEIPANIVNGTPLYFSPAVTRYIPESISPATLTTFEAFLGIIQPATHDHNAIILSCPVDRDTLVQITGLFYSVALTADTDVNYWSEIHPLLLVQAAIRQTHIASGNKPLLDLLDRSLDGELTRIGMDLVEQIIAEVDEMDA